MKKNILVILLLLLGCSTYAQNNKERKTAFSIGAEAAIPVGEESKGYGVGWGGSLQEEFLVGKAGITLNAGYIHYTTRRYVSEAIKNQVWLLAGVRYYFIKNTYVGGQIGPTALDASDHGGVVFAYAASTGFKLKRLDLSLWYMGYPVDLSFSTVSLRVAIIL